MFGYVYSLGFTSRLGRGYKPFINYTWQTVYQPLITDGVELVTNGTFDTDTSGWTAKNSILSVVSGSIRVADNGSGSAGYQAISVISGKKYILTFDLVGTSSGAAVYGVGTSAPDGISSVVGGTGQLTTNGNKTYSLIFTASVSTMYVTLCSLGSEYADFDNVSVKEVTSDAGMYVQNNGTSGTNLQLYSGNPLDFQGSQSIDKTSSTGRLPYSFWTNPYTVVFAGIWNSANINPFYFGGSADVEFKEVNSTQFRFNIYNGNSNPLFIPKIDNEYVVLKITNDMTTIRAYKNDIEVASMPYVAPSPSGAVESIGARSQLSTYADCQLDFCVFNQSVIMQSSYSNPNAFYDSMVNDANTLFATDFRGTAGYIADDKNLSKTELFTDFTSIVSGDYTNNTLTLIQNTSNDKAITDALLDSSKIYEVSYNVVSSDLLYIDSLYIGNPANTIYKQVTNNIGLNSFIFAPTFSDYSTFTLRNESEGKTILITDFSIKEISAVYPITNYSETMRTNFQQETTGLQDLTRSFDSLGFYTGVTDYLNGNGKGYGDTGWIPSASGDWSIECIMDFVGDNTTRWLGCGSGGVKFGERYNMPLRPRLEVIGDTTGYIYGSTNVTQGFHYLTITKNVNTYSLYSDGVFQSSTTVLNLKEIETFMLCAYRTAKIECIDRLFKVHNKVLTQEEITNNYNDYVAQGLLT